MLVINHILLKQREISHPPMTDPCYPEMAQRGHVEEENPVEAKVDADPKDVEKPPNKYHDSTYNRNKTLIAKYVNRILADYPTPTERYYDIRFVSGADRRSYFGEVGDQCIMFHSNRICLVALAPTHPVIAEDKTITDIEFQFEGDDNIDRLASAPKGKRKRGGQKLRKNAPICALLCADGSKYIVISCIGARLLEINRKIATNADLIKKRPLSSGFIAIIQPVDWKHLEEVKNSLPKLGQTVQVACGDQPGD